jgi:sarcosine oxidase subunit gamma
MNSAWIRELPPAARFIFQGDATARAAAAAIWKVPFSETACRAMSTGTRATLWLGPQEYLLWESPRPSRNEALGGLAESLLEHPCSLVDVSHRQVAWEIFGPSAETILAGACPLDLDAAHFPIGMCTRTLLAKADIILWRRQADVFHVETWRSFAPYVVGILHEIAAGYDTA